MLEVVDNIHLPFKFFCKKLGIVWVPNFSGYIIYEYGHNYFQVGATNRVFSFAISFLIQAHVICQKHTNFCPKYFVVWFNKKYF